MKLGLVSVTYRKKTVEEIIDITKKAGLDGIEWGGDVHVPCNDIENAKRVKKLTDEAGLEVFAYGSYYKIGQCENYKEEFEKVLSTAEVLKTDVIRIWGGTKAIYKYEKEEAEKLKEETKEIVKMAKEKNIKVAFECHPDTITEHYESALEFLSQIDGIYLYWQQHQGLDFETNVNALKAYLPYVVNVHTFYRENFIKVSIERGYDYWKEWLEILKSANRPINLMFEFFPEETDEWLFNETKVMNKLLAE